jgi:hypothetical protein
MYCNNEGVPFLHRVCRVSELPSTQVGSLANGKGILQYSLLCFPFCGASLLFFSFALIQFLAASSSGCLISSLSFRCSHFGTVLQQLFLAHCPLHPLLVTPHPSRSCKQYLKHVSIDLSRQQLLQLSCQQLLLLVGSSIDTSCH